ncbi:MAG: GTPase HflX, partial [Nitrosarchaeum sp.]|nr:GTPase HflX [Nitrosarchaeum sp.]
VGFISKLPAYMIDAFKSTLEELIHTDVIIVVVDISDSLFDLRKKFASCMRTLSELRVEMDRIIFALNKSDLLTTNEIEEKIEILNLRDYKKRIAVSAKTGYNVNELKNLIKDIIQSQNSPEFKKETPKEFDNIYGN